MTRQEQQILSALPKLIVIEGANGSGKTTLAKALQDQYDTVGVASVYLKTPDAPYRELLLGSADLSIEEITLIMRASHIAATREIEKHLNEGKTVILDRYRLSLYAMQGYASGMSRLLHLIEQGLTQTASKLTFKAPSYTVFLDLPYEVCQSRLQARSSETPDRFENISGTYDREVISGFKAIVNNATIDLGDVIHITDELPAGILAAMVFSQITDEILSGYAAFAGDPA